MATVNLIELDTRQFVQLTIQLAVNVKQMRDELDFHENLGDEIRSEDLIIAKRKQVEEWEVILDQVADAKVVRKRDGK